ncbi:MAG: hypothetical protein FWD60_11435 [Candidatus Azobacteroides sp.]|nr:hypothetical protein [Candidatus Azobacteroides sp.]
MGIFAKAGISKCQTEDEKSWYGLGTELVWRWYGVVMGRLILKKNEKMGIFFQNDFVCNDFVSFCTGVRKRSGETLEDDPFIPMFRIGMPISNPFRILNVSRKDILFAYLRRSKR